MAENLPTVSIPLRHCQKVASVSTFKQAQNWPLIILLGHKMKEEIIEVWQMRSLYFGWF